MKKIVSSLLAFFMVLAFVAPISVYADDTNVDIDEYGKNDTYSYFVSATSGKVVRINDDNSLLADVEEKDGNELSDKSLFKVEQNTEGTRVQIIRADTGKVWSSNGSTLSANANKMANVGTGSWEGFVIETDPGTNISKIKNFSGNYIVLNGDQMVIGTTDSNVAAGFYIMDPTYSDSTVYIEHVASGKYIRANGTNGDSLIVDGEKTGEGVIGNDLRYSPTYGIYNGNEVMNFVSKAYPTLAWKSGGKNEVYQNTVITAGGWESIMVVPNGDGTVSFKDSEQKTYITVTDTKTMKRGYLGELTENEKFIIHSVIRPKKVTNVKTSQIGETGITVSWSGVSQTLYTGYKVVATPPIGSGKEVVTSNETLATSVRLEGLVAGTAYQITVRTVNAAGSFGETKPLEAQTKNGPTPVQVTDLSAEESGANIKITWGAVDTATSYDLYRARSAFDREGYQLVASDITTTSYTDTAINADKYSNYYKVVAVNENGGSDISDRYTSLETTLFGNNMIFLADTDDTDKINQVVQEIFMLQNDTDADAQFSEDRYAIYYKPGDYTATQCIPIGFYTHIGGLGKTPYEVKLNNIEVPAYLDGRASNGGNYWDDGGTWRNATCNFWRSAENISVVGTGNATTVDVTTGGKSSNWNPSAFNWSVAQAAPLRRVYSTRVTSYDWSSGWASGGFTADSLLTGVNGSGNGAGTSSGQQFFTRNSDITGNGYGTTLNNFFLGVTAPNLPTAANGTELVNGNGYSNWAIPTAGGGQQVITNVTSTPVIREKPFLFLDDDGEYKVFVPSLQKNRVGTSWDTDDIGEGEIVSLEEFYIAKEGNTAADINEQLEAGKNIFFTPGVYHAEEVIEVNNSNTIVLGTGMASIIPDNEDAAMRVADVDGITIAGLIFDAGAYSKYLLQVGSKGSTNDHSDNPTLLADLFFRVGGTTSSLTKADDALEINSNDVIGDHFWIWRADHGAGVAWYGNESKHGLIVNGDNVTCYALFNEHFQGYNTLWNGENGATYFYQNETPYDPISQEAWMNHKGTTNGYSSYKVANKVNTHYAVGLGIYNCFIFTGPTYDSSEVQIQLDNAIEVPNKEGVIIENACIQTFAKGDGAMQKINHIINDCGEGVSSGIDKNTGEIGQGWSRKFILSYQNGECISGFFGAIVENGIQLMNDAGDVDLSALQALYDSALEKDELDYTAASWAVLLESLEEARIQLEDIGEDWANQVDVDATKDILQAGIDQLKSEANVKALHALYKANKDKDVSKYTKETKDAFTKALQEAKQILLTRDVNQDTVDNAFKVLEKAIADLKEIPTDNGTNNGTDDGTNNGTDDGTNNGVIKPNEKPAVTNPKGTINGVKTGDDTSIAVFGFLSVLVAGTYVALRKKNEEV